MNPSVGSGDLPTAIGASSGSVEGSGRVRAQFDPQTPMLRFIAPVPGVQNPPTLQYVPYPAPVWPTTTSDTRAESVTNTGYIPSPPPSDEDETRSPNGSAPRSMSGGSTAQKTLFIAGFPADVKEREVFNLLRFQPGFVDCSMTSGTSGKQAVAFASWQDHESANRCRGLLQGLRFDPYGPATHLRVQFARSESKTRRTVVDLPNPLAPPSPQNWHASSSSVVSSSSSPPNFLHGPNAPIASSATPSASGTSPPIGRQVRPARRPHHRSSGSRTSSPKHVRDEPKPSQRGDSAPYTRRSERQEFSTKSHSLPHGVSHSVAHTNVAASSSHTSNGACSTLFVTNLSMVTTEEDIITLFEQAPGFQRLHFQLNSEGLPICFVDFDTEVNSTEARTRFQGVTIHHSPIRIEFAKQKMKRPKER